MPSNASMFVFVAMCALKPPPLHELCRFKGWYSEYLSMIYVIHNGWSSMLDFNIQARDPRGTQFDTQSDNWGHVSILTHASADTLGPAPK